MSGVLAIIPARTGSKGIPGKNFRMIAGRSPINRAVLCAVTIDADIVITTDDSELLAMNFGPGHTKIRAIQRPPELAQDDTPMIDVIKDVLARVPGPEDQTVVLLQPTQPLRKPKHILRAIQLLQEHPTAESVVSVVEIPKTHHPDWQFIVWHGGLFHQNEDGSVSGLGDVKAARRQDLEPRYIRDGTVYAFKRKTVSQFGNIYGLACLPLIMDPAETCALDTPADWAEAERRLTQ